MLASVDFLVPLYFCPEKLSLNSLANQQTSFMCSTTACLQHWCWLAVFVTPKLASAVKGFPSHADGSPWCQNTAWLMWLLKSGTGQGSMFLFPCRIVKGGKATLRLGICLADVMKLFQVHKEVANVRSGHLLILCSGWAQRGSTVQAFSLSLKGHFSAFPSAVAQL